MPEDIRQERGPSARRPGAPGAQRASGDGGAGGASGSASSAEPAGGRAGGSGGSGGARASSGAAQEKRRWRRRARRASTSAGRAAARRSVVLKTAACVVVLGACLALALVVGTDENRPTVAGWVPFVACVTAIVIAFAYVRVLKRSIVLLEKSSAVDVRRDEKVQFKVRFSNRSPLFAFRLEAHFFTADLYGNPMNHAVTTVALGPFEKYDMPFTARFEHIGIYQAGLDHVVIYDFLRLFSATIDGPKRIRVQVLPRLVDIGRLELSSEAAVEAAKAARSVLSDTMDYASVREYVWGDPIKNIHWKISARTESYMTKLFETYNEPGVAVILDFYGPGQNALELMRMFDCVVEAGFSVARYARLNGLDAEIHYCDKRGERARIASWRASDLPLIVQDLPQFSSDPKHAPDALGILEDQIKSMHGQSNLVVCTANLSARMVDTVIAAKAQRRQPLMIAVVPERLEGRKRDQCLAPLARLDAVGIGHVAISSADELKEVR